MTNTPVAPAAPKYNPQTLFFTMPSSVPQNSSKPTVASTFGNGQYVASIEEAIATANMQSASYVRQGLPGIVYVMGVVAVVRPKAPIEPPTIVERFDLPCSK